jgi:signal transduction histidine kinase
MDGRAIQVLLVEDNRRDVRLVQEAIGEVPSARCTLEAVDRLSDALQRMAATRYDVVLLDLSLPDQSGLETVQQMCGSHPEVPVVVLTELDDESLAVSAVHCGAQDYLLKGQINGYLLLRSMRYAIERCRAGRMRKLLETRLQRAQRLESLAVLAGGIAHDFNNLLMGILGNAGLALMDLWPGSRSRRYIEQIEKAAKRAAELTNQMLAYSGRGKFVVTPLDLGRLVEESRALFEPAASAGAVLRLHPGTCPPVEGDADQLHQLLLSLVTNAFEALEGGQGTVTVSTGVVAADETTFADCYLNDDLPPGPYAYLEVRDTGIGMDPLTREKLFEPFYSTKFTGRGLGLAAALGIVRGHRGAIKVATEPGHGSTFTVYLPCGPQAALETAARPATSASEDGLPAWGATATVLAVDDEESVRAMLRLTLERQGFEVVTARDGREALQHFRENPRRFDVVVLDVMMPVLGGEEVFRELRSLQPQVRVLFCSGYSPNDSLEHLLRTERIDFLQKPYGPAALMQKLNALLRRSASPV